MNLRRPLHVIIGEIDLSCCFRPFLAFENYFQLLRLFKLSEFLLYILIVLQKSNSQSWKLYQSGVISTYFALCTIQNCLKFPTAKRLLEFHIFLSRFDFSNKDCFRSVQKSKHRKIWCRVLGEGWHQGGNFVCEDFWRSFKLSKNVSFCRKLNCRLKLACFFCQGQAAEWR